MNRFEILESVNRVLSERQETHGDAYAQFSLCAKLVNAYFGTDFTPADMATINRFQKMSRDKIGGFHIDNTLDSIGYTAIEGELRCLDATKVYSEQEITAFIENLHAAPLINRAARLKPNIRVETIGTPEYDQVEAFKAAVQAHQKPPAPGDASDAAQIVQKEISDEELQQFLDLQNETPIVPDPVRRLVVDLNKRNTEVLLSKPKSSK